MSNLEPVVLPETYEALYGDMPVQRDGKSGVWGVNAFAQLSVHGGEFSAAVAQQIRYRILCLRGLGAALSLGLWIAAVDREAVVTVPGASSEDEVELSRPDGADVIGLRATEHAAAWRKLLKWQFGACSEYPVAEGKIVTGAMSYPEHDSAELGFVPCSTPLTDARPSSRGTLGSRARIPRGWCTGRFCLKSPLPWPWNQPAF